MKKFLTWIIAAIFILQFSQAQAEVKIDRNENFAVMDFGSHAGTSDDENVGIVASDYIIEKLVEKNFNIIDKEMLDEKPIGIIDPDTAKEIGEILGVRYLIYGNVVDVVNGEDGANIAASVKLRSIKAHVVARLMDVETGKILMAAKGEGKSKSSSIGGDLLMIGTVKVSKENVHNAIRKASEQVVEILLSRCKIS